MSDILLEPFSDAHLEAAVRLSQAEKWPHRAEDWAMVVAASQGFVATTDERVVGTAFTTPFAAIPACHLGSWSGLLEAGSGVAMARGEEPHTIRDAEPTTFALVSQAFG